jgi:hypothetical protein
MTAQVPSYPLRKVSTKTTKPIAVNVLCCVISSPYRFFNVTRCLFNVNFQNSILVFLA